MSSCLKPIATFEELATALSACDDSAKLLPTTGTLSSNYTHYLTEGSPQSHPLVLESKLQHKLRRKTPNGFVNDGYDGASSSIYPTLPPLKHKVSAPLRRVKSVVRTTASVHVSCHRNNSQPAANLGNDDHRAQAAADAPSLYLTDSPHHSQLPLLQGRRISVAADLNSHSSSVRVGKNNLGSQMNEYDLAATYHRSRSSAIPRPAHNISLAASSSRDCTWAVENDRDSVPNLCHGDGPAVQTAPSAVCDRIQGLHTTYLSDGTLPCKESSNNGDFRRLYTCVTQTLNYTKSASDRLSQLEFRARALRCAHESYVKLLEHLQDNGRSSVDKNLQVFNFGVSDMDWHASPIVSSGFAPDSGRASLMSDAVSSLDVLDSLCKQSDWRWLDGMLLGGCLQYGLGYYGSALQWFSRILELDTR